MAGAGSEFENPSVAAAATAGDALSTTSFIDFDDSLVEKALIELKKALEIIPRDLKIDYLEATKQCPELVASESDPKRFLRREDCNPWAAAMRLVTYWRMRREIFKEKAFLKLTDALEPHDIDVLRSGINVFLPPDKDGSPVMCTDISRLENASEISNESRQRYTFYLQQTLSEDPESQRTGSVYIIVLNQHFTSYTKSRGGGGRTPIDLAAFAMPVKLKGIYLVQPRDPEFLSAFLAYAGRFMGYVVRSIQGETKSEILQKLERCGLSKAGLPPSVGGTWSYKEFYQRLIDEGLIAKVAEDQTQLLSLQPSPGTYNAKPSSLTANAARQDEGMYAELSRALHLLSDNADYFEAERLGLVDSESPHSRFLACDNFDPWPAARRLQAYWKLRRRLFGDRAFSSLDLLGTNGLTSQEQEVLDSGFITFLPPDNDNCQVICLNFARESGRIFSEENKLRCFFYLFSVASEQESAQKEGIVLLHVFENPVTKIWLPFEDFKAAIPVHFKMVHNVARPPKSLCGLLSENVAPILRVLGDSIGNRFSICISDSGEEIVQRLKSNGMSEWGLPVEIGGTWNADDGITAWKTQRSVLELAKHGNLVASPEGQSRTRPNSPDTNTNRKKQAKTDDFEAEPPICETASFVAQALQELESAIAMLPADLKESLLEARLRVPNICNKDAPPIRFLRVERFNPWSAAQRLCLYWKRRKEYFGERAFLPLDLTSEGALSRDDLAYLQTGYGVLLEYDSKGRSVVFFDSARRSSFDKMSRVRHMFYLLNVISENSLSQTEGIVILSAVRANMHKPDPKGIVELIEHALPNHVHAVNLVSCHPENGNKSRLEQFTQPLLNLIGKCFGGRFNVHAYRTKEELAKSLENIGLIVKHLPKCMGGEWVYEDFELWQEQRMRYEWELPTKVKSKRTAPHVPRYKARVLSSLSEEEQVERKRRLNILNSRRSRGRKRAEVEGLQEHVEHLQERNAAIEAENHRLESLIQDANYCVRAGQEPDERAVLRAVANDFILPTDQAATTELNQHQSSTDIFSNFSPMVSSNYESVPHNAGLGDAQQIFGSPYWVHRELDATAGQSFALQYLQQPAPQVPFSLLSSIHTQADLEAAIRRQLLLSQHFSQANPANLAMLNLPQQQWNASTRASLGIGATVDEDARCKALDELLLAGMLNGRQEERASAPAPAPNEPR